MLRFVVFKLLKSNHLKMQILHFHQRNKNMWQKCLNVNFAVNKLKLFQKVKICFAIQSTKINEWNNLFLHFCKHKLSLPTYSKWPNFSVTHETFLIYIYWFHLSLISICYSANESISIIYVFSLKSAWSIPSFYKT